jgi:uncharacterized protein YeaO (DUF488 family)
MLKLKRAYEPAARSDGQRILVDRLWPRGLSRRRLAIDDWMKELAPSAELRRWFAHDPKKWPEFQRRYKRELRAHSELVRRLASVARRSRVTLIFGARDELHNDAVGRPPIDRVAPAASLFVSRVDAEVDKRIDAVGARLAILRGLQPPPTPVSSTLRFSTSSAIPVGKRSRRRTRSRSVHFGRALARRPPITRTSATSNRSLGRGQSLQCRLRLYGAFRITAWSSAHSLETSRGRDDQWRRSPSTHRHGRRQSRP